MVMRRNSTTRHVLDTESREQQNRRQRRLILKKEFRKTAEKIATNFFGKWVPQIDIIKDERFCTAELVAEIKKRSTPEEFSTLLSYFLNAIELESGKLENPHIIHGRIVMNREALREKMSAGVIELLMATEDEGFVSNVLRRMMDNKEGLNILMLDNLLILSRKGYVHTLITFSKAFLQNPEKAIAIMDQATTRTSIPSDIVLASVIEERLKA